MALETKPIGGGEPAEYDTASKSALVLDEHDWEVLAAICEFYIEEANEHCHAGRALAHRIIEAGCCG